MTKLIQVQVVAVFANVDEDGEIADILGQITFTPSPSEWKRGWDWQAAFAKAVENLRNPPASVVE